MQSRERSTASGPTIDIALYSTFALADRRKRVAERTMSHYIVSALEDTAYNYRITYMHPLVEDAGENVSHCRGETFDHWRDLVNNDEIERRANDANILLCDAPGGGCGAVGGRVATAPARHIEYTMPYQRTGTGRAHSNIHATLHELAHNLGCWHDHDDDRPGKQHCGLGWNQPVTLFGFELPFLGGDWHRTPSVAGNGAPNRCDEYIENRNFSSVVYHQYFHDCALNNFEVAD